MCLAVVFIVEIAQGCCGWRLNEEGLKYKYYVTENTSINVNGTTNFEDYEVQFFMDYTF
jgi:hypothetical protein